MPLKDYQPLTDEVVAGNTTIQIRGLSFEDCTTLLRKNMSDLEKATDILDQLKGIGDPQQRSDALVAKLLNDVPGLVASVILLGVNEEEKDMAMVARLPLPVQLDALVRILNITFEEVGGVKNFLGTLIPMLEKMGLGVPVQSIMQLLGTK